MNCAYHSHNVAVVNCNGCGKPLCPSCDHRVKGFPFCQDCIVSGVEMLRNHNQSNYAPFVKKQTSPVLATVFSLVCPGLGAAYNGQTSKALIHFAVFIGFFQMAISTGMALFVLGFLGIWGFTIVDAWRTAQAIRSGITPDEAQDILVQRFSGNPKAWGIVLTVLGISFFVQTFFGLKSLTRFVLPALLIGLGVYLLREFIFKKKDSARDWNKYQTQTNNAPDFVSALGQPQSRIDEGDYQTQTRVRNWKNR